MRKSNDAADVPIQVTVPAHVKKSLDVLSATTGRTKRSLILEALTSLGLKISQTDIDGPRRSSK